MNNTMKANMNMMSLNNNNKEVVFMNTMAYEQIRTIGMDNMLSTMDRKQMNTLLERLSFEKVYMDMKGRTRASKRILYYIDYIVNVMRHFKKHNKHIAKTTKTTKRVPVCKREAGIITPKMRSNVLKSVRHYIKIFAVRRLNNYLNMIANMISSNNDNHKNNNNVESSVKVDYNQVMLDSFGLDDNSFMDNNESYSYKLNSLTRRFVNGASGSASTSINKLNGGCSMNIKYDLDNMTVAQLKVVCRDEEIKGYSKYHKKAELLTFIKDELAKRSLVNNESVEEEPIVVDNFEEKEETIEEVVYSNVPVIKGTSDSEQEMEYLNKIPNQYKYAHSFIINCINVFKNDGEINFKQEYREIGNLGIMQFFDIDEEEDRVIIASKDSNDDYDKHDQRVYTCNPDGRYRFVDFCNGLVLVDFSNEPGHKLNEKDIETINAKGLYVYAGKDKMEYSLEKPEVPAPIVIRYFRTYAFSPSTLKHNKMYFAEINKEHTIESRMQEIDALSGGAVIQAIKELQKESINVLDKNYFAALAKIAVRASARAATPMLDFGETGNILVINTKLRPVEEFNEEDRKALEEAGIEIDTDFSDGSLNISVKYIQKQYKELFNTELTYRQAMRISLQLRASIVCAKGYGKVYNDDQIFRKTIAICEEYGEKVLLYNEDMKGSMNGKEIIAALNKHDDESKEVEKFIRKIDLIGTKNEFKLINFEALESGKKAEVCIINTFNPTESGHSIQQGNKVVDRFSKEYAELVAAQALLDLQATDVIENSGLKLNKTLDGLNGDAIKNCIKLARTEEDRLDKALAIRSLRDKDKFILSKIAKMNSNGNSFYLVLTPWDMYLSNKKHVLRKRTINHVDSFGKVHKVDALEAYNASFNEWYRNTLIDLMCDSSLTDEQKDQIKEALHTGVIIKYPTQGKEEFILFYLMTDEEFEERVNSPEFGFTKPQIKELIDYVTVSAYSELLVANDNSMKAQIAGLDFDGDTAKVEIHAVGTDIDDRFIYGVKNPNTDKMLNDYVSMCVELVELRGNVYSTACITYKLGEDENNKAIGCYKVNKNNVSYNKANKKHSRNYGKLTYGTHSSDKATLSYNKHVREMTGEFFTMTTSDFREFASNGIDSELFNKVTDLLGLLCATASCGDNIGKTIKAGSVVLLSDVDKVWFKNGVFNFELAKDLFIPLRRNIKYFTTGKGKGQDREAVWAKNYETIYREGENLFYVTNKLGIKRAYYRVSRLEVEEFITKISKLSITTTREEWMILCRDFNHITRGLGESSIDIMKDITKNLGADMTKDIVDSRFKIIGNLKAKDLTSNIYELTNSTRNGRYDVDFHDFEMDENNKPILPVVLEDPIGAAKIEIYKELSKAIDDDIQLINSSCNYDRYAKYETLANMEAYPATNYSICYVLDYYTELFNPNNKTLKNPNVETRNRILSGLLNIANMEGCSIEEFMKIAIYIACINRRHNKDSVSKYEVFNTNRKYIAALNILYLILGDLMVQEFNGGKSLNVELTIARNMQRIPERQILNFVEGKCTTEGFEITLNELFTGKAIAMGNKIVTSWNVFKKFEAEEDIVLLSIRDLALNEDTFENYNIDPEGEKGFGIDSLTNDRYAKLVKLTDNYGEDILGMEDADGHAIGTLNTLAIDKLVDKEIIDISIIGNIDNGLIVARLASC